MIGSFVAVALYSTFGLGLATAVPLLILGLLLRAGRSPRSPAARST